jgi:hypothetical protein
MFFQLLFYSVMGNYFFLGSMDHLMSRSGIVSATNKDSINIGRCTALWDVICFNSGSWFIAFYLLSLAYVTVLETEDWDYTAMPEIPDDLLYSLMFAGPAALMAAFAFFVPLILNPYVIGWPFHPSCCRKRVDQKEKKQLSTKNHRRTGSNNGSGRIVDLHTFMAKDPARELGREIGRIQARPDIELGSLATNDFGGSKYPMSVGSPLEPSPMLTNGRKPPNQPRMERSQARPAAERPTSNGGHNRTTQSGAGKVSNKKPLKLAMI